VVRVLDLRSTGRGKLLTHTCASVTKQHNLVPANGWWCCVACWEGNLGLGSHWPRVTDISGSPATGSRPGRRWAPAYALLVQHGWLYLLLGYGFPFSAMTLLVGEQVGHLACKKLDAGMLAQCIVIGPVCVCNGRLWVCVYGSVTMITRNCVHRSSPNWVCR